MEFSIIDFIFFLTLPLRKEFETCNGSNYYVILIGFGVHYQNYIGQYIVEQMKALYSTRLLVKKLFPDGHSRGFVALLHYYNSKLVSCQVVGILLKNIPYNIGQFGRLECINGTVLDTVNDLDDINEHSSWKRSVPDEEEDKSRLKRSSGTLLVHNISHVMAELS